MLMLRCSVTGVRTMGLGTGLRTGWRVRAPTRCCWRLRVTGELGRGALGALRRARAGWAFCKKGCHEVSCQGFPVGSDGIFQIKDQRIRAASVRLGELLFTVTGNEQPGPWGGIVHQIASCDS
jgi:hypothetical protein